MWTQNKLSTAQKESSQATSFSFRGDDVLKWSRSVVVTPIIKSLMKQFTVVPCEI
jgi:hypothetical protein